MKSEDRKAKVLEYVEAFNRGDVDGVCRCFASGAVVYGVLGWGEIEKARPVWDQLVRCFAMQLHVEAMACEGEIVAVRYRESGKFVSAFRNQVPTGMAYEVVAMEWFEISTEGILRRWGARDSASIFRQMGISPT